MYILEYLRCVIFSVRRCPAGGAAGCTVQGNGRIGHPLDNTACDHDLIHLNEEQFAVCLVDLTSE